VVAHSTLISDVLQTEFSPGVIRLNAFCVKNISSVRLKIAVGSMPSSLYISKPLHSGTLQIFSFHLRISPASPAFYLQSPPLGWDATPLSPLPRETIWIRRGIQEFLRNRPNTFPERSKSHERQPEIDRLHFGTELPPILQRQTRRIIDVCYQDRQK